VVRNNLQPYRTGVLIGIHCRVVNASIDLVSQQSPHVRCKGYGCCPLPVVVKEACTQLYKWQCANSLALGCRA